MERREFLTAAAGLAMTPVLRGALDTYAPHATRQTQGPALGPEVFARRLERLQEELKTRKLDLLVVEPSTNFQYFARYNPGRSERLILLMIPAAGTPALICPSFEVERIKRNSVMTDVRGWEEQDDPWRIVRKVGTEMKPPNRNGTAAVEPSTSYLSYLRLADRLSGWKFVDGGPVTERLRIIKSPDELDRIRRAIAVTEAAIAATFAQLAVGMTERDVAQLLSREMSSRGSSGGGLVQFGPSSALPHGGPSAGQ